MGTDGCHLEESVGRTRPQNNSRKTCSSTSLYILWIIYERRWLADWETFLVFFFFSDSIKSCFNEPAEESLQKVSIEPEFFNLYAYIRSILMIKTNTLATYNIISEYIINKT